jgi:tRNA threonylcarbamoyladenosine biosynthesis protein TsaB
MSHVILAIETTTDACSVALGMDGTTHQMLVVEPRGHLSQVPRMLAQLLSDAGIERSAIDQVVVSRGPGSFTGVRIGVGYAQGLALGLGVPLVGLSTLETLAWGAARRGGIGRTLVALDARMGEVYWACFDLGGDGPERLSDDALSAPRAVSLPAGGNWSAIGPGAVAYPGELRAAYRDTGSDAELAVEAVASLPEARDLIAGLAVGHPGADGGLPVYLRDEVVSRN